MRGSIAIWHDTPADGAHGYAPKVEIHINIWKGNRRNNRRHFDLFDIGFRFKEIRSLRTLAISLPFAIEERQLSDLFGIMCHSDTLSAIFNESLSAGALQDDERIFAACDERDKVQFYVCRCSHSDMEFTAIGKDDDAGSVILFKEEFCNQLKKNVGDQYFRLRIRVPIGTKNAFISEVTPEDVGFLSTISTNEIVEFRLNDRRNFSPAIRGYLKGRVDLIEVSAVHYFLVRDMSVEMTQSHTAFKKMRRLEPAIWKRYLDHEPQFDSENMIIYHWSSRAAPQSSLESFTALATFRAYDTGWLSVYALVVIMLGTMGSALQALLAVWLSHVASRWNLEDPWLTVGANVPILAFFALALWLFVRWNRRKSLKPFWQAIEFLRRGE
jgi:hypothetical protein